jgi:uncharacterized damage-inducible protein DinB
MVERVEPPHAGNEKDTLNAFLNFQRETMLWKAEGLSQADLGQHHVPSKLTLLGILKHLTDVEHWWFSVVFDGQPDTAYYWEKDGVFDSEFDLSDDDDLNAIVTLYKQECDRSRAIVAAASLDSLAASPNHDHSLRWILTHMIEETARHVGQADILRELTDGAIGE